ncbi:Bcr/CflA family multidrug efflux MFS transporter [Streptomyces avidinii]|uniref:DHA1 family bicyclomycin/chloramphenicol resistance-like MFS transporter n=1 Tax=Streptomyces avidinii TaxID=1895 RepID=A0ABS4L224_STRAV|nr:Bcr/CflA family multidrug efflux MFS transporter [Streptomyces avidinii]MBP2036331.1 DHA1 family bicyclomycin/chloramphenicol resistance-like MFS transporter [Streptomyces avidinii]GGY82358.1 Bcr/CflA family drug resistance efflux transporter [Streptomyces avidinii]
MPERGPATAPSHDSSPDSPSAPTPPIATVPLTAARRTSLLVTFILGGLTALPPLSMDMYLPALPQVTDALHSPAATVQLTLTACLAGMALGQLVIGPMSDKWGRRRPLLTGMVVYVLATAICALAPTTELLISFRLLQGLAGAAAIVIARAVVRDLYDGDEMARFFSTLMLISGAAPIIAPLIGGQVLRFADWRGVFLVLTVVGAVLTLMVWRGLGETLPPERRHTGGVGSALRTMRGLLGDRVFAGYTLTGGFSFAVLFSYISASPFVVQEIYGASPQAFALLFGLNSVGLILVGQINGKLLVGRVRLDKVLAVGLAVVTAAAVALLLMSTGVFGEVGLTPIAAALFVLMSAMGVVLPNTNAQALMRTPHAAGSASALLGTSSFLIGAIASPLVGIAGEDTAVPMAVVQLVCALLAVSAFLGLCRPWQSASAKAGLAGV